MSKYTYLSLNNNYMTLTDRPIKYYLMSERIIYLYSILYILGLIIYNSVIIHLPMKYLH